MYVAFLKNRPHNSLISLQTGGANVRGTVKVGTNGDEATNVTNGFHGIPPVIETAFTNAAVECASRLVGGAHSKKFAGECGPETPITLLQN